MESNRAPVHQVSAATRGAEDCDDPIDGGRCGSGVRLSANAGLAGERSFWWEPGGWAVRSRNRPILGTQAMYAWKRELHCYRGQHLPEALFGESSLELRHAESGLTISFCALEVSCVNQELLCKILSIEEEYCLIRLFPRRLHRQRTYSIHPIHVFGGTNRYACFFM